MVDVENTQPVAKKRETSWAGPILLTVMGMLGIIVGGLSALGGIFGSSKSSDTMFGGIDIGGGATGGVILIVGAISFLCGVVALAAKSREEGKKSG